MDIGFLNFIGVTCIYMNKNTHSIILKKEISFSSHNNRYFSIALYLLLLLSSNICYKIEICFVKEDEFGSDSFNDKCALENLDSKCIGTVQSNAMRSIEENFNDENFISNKAVQYSQTLNSENSMDYSFRFNKTTQGAEIDQNSIFNYENYQKCYNNKSDSYMEFMEEDDNIVGETINSSALNEKYNFEMPGFDCIAKNNSSLVFEYPGKFEIRSKYFDRKFESNTHCYKLNIAEITRNAVDFQTFRIFLTVLRLGCNPISFGLQKEQLMNFVELFFDLYCYSESIIILNIFKCLFPLLVLYKYEMFDNEIIRLNQENLFRYRKILISFFKTFYESINVIFDVKENEILFFEKCQPKKFYFFNEKNIQNIKIRTTPDAINYMKNKIFDEKKTEMYLWLLSIYEIDGIRVSYDNIYYSECIDSDFASNFLCETANSVDTEPVCLDFMPFNVFIPKEDLNIKYIELERINISSKMLLLIKDCSNLESLILVKCVFPVNFIASVYIYENFKNLKIFRYVGFPLYISQFKNLIFKNLVALDLSCSFFRGSIANIKFPEQKPSLKCLRLDYSKLNVFILNFLIKDQSLEILSLRGVILYNLLHTDALSGWQNHFYFLDISRCKFNFLLSKGNLFQNLDVWILYLENFDTVEPNKILSQKSLHQSTRKLSLSQSLLSPEILYYLQCFEYLEHLNLSGLPVNHLRWAKDNIFYNSNLQSLDLSDWTISQEDLISLSRFKYLKELYIPRCDLNAGSMKYLLKEWIHTNVFEKIDVSENQLDLSDLALLCQLTCLIHLIFSVESSIFYNCDRIFEDVRFINLKILVFVRCFVNKSLFKFILAQVALKILEFRESRIGKCVFSYESFTMLRFLETINFLHTILDQEDIKILEQLQSIGICVNFYENNIL